MVAPGPSKRQKLEVQAEAESGAIGFGLSSAVGADGVLGDVDAEDEASLGLEGARLTIKDESGCTPSSAQCSELCRIGVVDIYQGAVTDGEMNTLKCTFSSSSSSCTGGTAAVGPAAIPLGATAAAASSSPPESLT